MILHACAYVFIRVIYLYIYIHFFNENNAIISKLERLSDFPACRFRSWDFNINFNIAHIIFITYMIF